MMARDKALERAEKKTDNKINFLTSHFLKEGFDKYIEDAPRLSLRRGKNLADLVANAKKNKQEGGSGPCGKGCKLCRFMEEAR